MGQSGAWSSLTFRYAAFVSKGSVSSVLEKFKGIHKRRISIEELAREFNPVIRGVINYYCKFWSYHTHELWTQLNKRLKKWVKWEKGLYTLASVRLIATQVHKPSGLICTLEIGTSVGMVDPLWIAYLCD